MQVRWPWYFIMDGNHCCDFVCCPRLSGAEETRQRLADESPVQIHGKQAIVMRNDDVPHPRAIQMRTPPAVKLPRWSHMREMREHYACTQVAAPYRLGKQRPPWITKSANSRILELIKMTVGRYGDTSKANMVCRCGKRKQRLCV